MNAFIIDRCGHRFEPASNGIPHLRWRLWKVQTAEERQAEIHFLPRLICVAAGILTAASITLYFCEALR